MFKYHPKHEQVNLTSKFPNAMSSFQIQDDQQRITNYSFNKNNTLRFIIRGEV